VILLQSIASESNLLVESEVTDSPSSNQDLKGKKTNKHYFVLRARQQKTSECICRMFKKIVRMDSEKMIDFDSKDVNDLNQINSYVKISLLQTESTPRFLKHQSQ